MVRVSGLVCVCAIACGGPASARPDASAPDAYDDPVLDALRALPGVTADQIVPVSAPAGYKVYAVTIDQLVDHDDPQSAHFAQHLTLEVVDPTRPTVQFNTGYWDYWGDYPFEVTSLLHANQMSIEHRFFGASRPVPADWTKLTIAQDAADQHHITETFKAVLTGPWIAAGGSKGGMTSVFHARFFPDDVAGTAAYATPISFANPDYRYDTWTESTIGTQPCRDAVKALAAEILQHRRAAMIQRATAEASARQESYTRVAIGPAVEASATGLYWSFWQYFGSDACAMVPATTATDDDIWAMLEGTPDGLGPWRRGVSPVYGNDDDNLAAFDPYEYQVAAQLGSPGTTDSYLNGLTIYTSADYAGAWPAGVAMPAYDSGAAMQDVATWVKAQGRRTTFVYGGWDPWTGGAYDITSAPDAVELTVPSGNHDSGMIDLAAGDQAIAFARLQAWTGVAPDPNNVPHALAFARPRLPRPPTALLRVRELSTP